MLHSGVRCRFKKKTPMGHLAVRMGAMAISSSLACGKIWNPVVQYQLGSLCTWGYSWPAHRARRLHSAAGYSIRIMESYSAQPPKTTRNCYCHLLLSLLLVLKVCFSPTIAPVTTKVIPKHVKFCCTSCMNLQAIITDGTDRA